MLHLSTKNYLTPEQEVGVGHFHHNAVAARREARAALLAAKAMGIAAKTCSKKAQRRRQLHEVALIEIGAMSEGVKRPTKERYHFRRR